MDVRLSGNLTRAPLSEVLDNERVAILQTVDQRSFVGNLYTCDALMHHKGRWFSANVSVITHYL
jgi:hypothetical protein